MVDKLKDKLGVWEKEKEPELLRNREQYRCIPTYSHSIKNNDGSALKNRIC